MSMSDITFSIGILLPNEHAIIDVISLTHLQLAAVAALCVQYEAEFRPNMTIVVKALSPLLQQRPAPAASEPTPEPAS